MRRGKSLRMITKRKKAVKQSKYKCVYWNKASSKWVARKRVKGKTHNLGSFTNALAAARKVNAFCKSQGIALANNLPVPKKKTSNRKTKRNMQRAATCVPKRKQRKVEFESSSAEPLHTKRNRKTKRNTQRAATRAPKRKQRSVECESSSAEPARTNTTRATYRLTPEEHRIAEEVAHNVSVRRARYAELVSCRSNKKARRTTINTIPGRLHIIPAKPPREHERRNFCYRFPVNYHSPPEL